MAETRREFVQRLPWRVGAVTLAPEILAGCANPSSRDEVNLGTVASQLRAFSKQGTGLHMIAQVEGQPYLHYVHSTPLPGRATGIFGIQAPQEDEEGMTAYFQALVPFSPNGVNHGLLSRMEQHLLQGEFAYTSGTGAFADAEELLLRNSGTLFFQHSNGEWGDHEVDAVQSITDGVSVATTAKNLRSEHLVHYRGTSAHILSELAETF